MLATTVTSRHVTVELTPMTADLRQRAAASPPLHRHPAPPIMHQATLVLCWLLVVVAVRGGLADATSRALAARSHLPVVPSAAAAPAPATNSSCRGFLIGIGVQKGGTTALWQYLQDGAHPQLQVSRIKEVGFWHELRAGKYAGCRVGDYLQLLTAGQQQHGQQHQHAELPLCAAPGARPQTSTPGSAARLAPSQDCRLGLQPRQPGPVQGKPAATASAQAVPVGSFHAHDRDCPQGLLLPGDLPPARPWWWVGAWPTPRADCLNRRTQPRQQQQQQQQQQQDTPASSNPEDGLRRHILQQDPPGQPLFHVDITPRLFLDPAVPPSVRALLPEARIVVMLRDPVSRALSNFNMWWQNHRPPNASSDDWAWTLEAQVDAELTRLRACHDATAHMLTPALQPDLAECLGLSHPFDPRFDAKLFANRLLQQSLYADGLQRWFSLFPAASFRVWVSEDFKANPASHIRELVAWLGLDPAALHPKLHAGSRPVFKPVHARTYEGTPQAAVVERMRAFLAPHNQRLFELLEAKGFGGVAGRLRQLW